MWLGEGGRGRKIGRGPQNQEKGGGLKFPSPLYTQYVHIQVATSQPGVVVLLLENKECTSCLEPQSLPNSPATKRGEREGGGGRGDVEGDKSASYSWLNNYLHNTEERRWGEGVTKWVWGLQFPSPLHTQYFLEKILENYFLIID